MDAETGAEIWKFGTGGAIGSTPIIYNDTIYIGSFDRKFYAINLDGTEKWCFDGADNWFWGKAVAYDDIIIAGCLDYRVYALDAETGEQARTPFETEGEIRADPALVGDLVIIGSDDDKVYALDASTGEQAWLPFVADDHIRAPLFADEDTVYFYTNAGTLYALDTEQGGKLWEEVSREP